MGREPVDTVVVGDQLVLVLLRGHEPGLDRVVHQGRALAPVVRVVMHGHALLEQQPALLEIACDRLVGILEPQPADQRKIGLEMAVALDGVEYGHALGRGHPEVVGAEGGGFVGDAGTVVGGDEIGRDHAPGPVGLGMIGETVVGRLVPPANERIGTKGFQNFGPLAQGGVHAGLGHDIDRPVLAAGLGIFDARPDRQGHVGRHGPGRGRPGQKCDVRLVFEEELHRDRRVLHFLVAQADLVRGQHRARARRIPVNLVALVKQALFVELLEQPPDRLDVFVGEGDVGRVQIRPEPDASGQLVPLRLVAQNRLATGGVVFGDAVVLDILTRGKTEFLFYLDLDRQAVGVPARLAIDPIAAHRLVATEGVLDRAPEHMVNTRPTVGRGRAFIKGEGRAIGTRGGAGLENVLLIPPAADIAVQCRQIQRLVFGETGHGRGVDPGRLGSQSATS